MSFWFCLADPPIVVLVLGSTLNADDIKEGDDVYFECHVRANPHWRRLTWLHNGITLNHNMSGRIIHSNQSLVLQKVTRQSAGKYRCSVVNSEGETVSDELDFRVQCKYFQTLTLINSNGSFCQEKHTKYQLVSNFPSPL
nr:unnamed protein product [Callosobruchus chinensis]